MGDHDKTNTSLAITLKKGKNYALRLDYREHTGAADIELRDSTPRHAASDRAADVSVPRSGGHADQLAAVVAEYDRQARCPASADAYVRNGTFADTIFGIDAALQVKNATTPGLLRVSLSEIQPEEFLDDHVGGFAAVRQASVTQPRPNLNGKYLRCHRHGLGRIHHHLQQRADRHRQRVGQRRHQRHGGKYYQFDLTSYFQAQKAAGHNVVTLAVEASEFLEQFISCLIPARSRGEPATVGGWMTVCFRP